MDISHVLLKERGKRNYSQQQVAELLEVSQSTYCDWESGNSHPKVENLLKIAQLFELDLNELLNPSGVNIVNSPNTISNSPHSKVETPEALMRIAENLEKLILVIEKMMTK